MAFKNNGIYKFLANKLSVLRHSTDKFEIPTIIKRNFFYRNPGDLIRDGNVKKMPSGACESWRYVLRQHKTGYSFHWTILYPQSCMFIHYKNHVESVLCISGECVVEIVQDKSQKGFGEFHHIKPGGCYTLDGHEAHYLSNESDKPCHLICVFNPACVGTEVQDENGVFPLFPDEPDDKKQTIIEPLLIDQMEEYQQKASASVTVQPLIAFKWPNEVMGEAFSVGNRQGEDIVHGTETINENPSVVILEQRQYYE